MAHSYKKHPISKDNQGKQLKKDKRRHSRGIRNLEDMPLREKSSHKKILRDSWDIHDYISRWTEEEARQHWREVAYGEHMRVSRSYYTRDFLKKYPTEEDYIKKVWSKVIRK